MADDEEISKTFNKQTRAMNMYLTVMGKNNKVLDNKIRDLGRTGKTINELIFPFSSNKSAYIPMKTLQDQLNISERVYNNNSAISCNSEVDKLGPPPRDNDLWTFLDGPVKNILKIFKVLGELESHQTQSPKIFGPISSKLAPLILLYDVETRRGKDKERQAYINTMRLVIPFISSFFGPIGKAGSAISFLFDEQISNTAGWLWDWWDRGHPANDIAIKAADGGADIATGALAFMTSQNPAQIGVQYNVLHASPIHEALNKVLEQHALNTVQYIKESPKDSPGAVLNMINESAIGTGGILNRLNPGYYLNKLNDWYWRFASGGILSTPRLGLVAEAGPEAIIPLSPRMRSRGEALWQKAGSIMGLNPVNAGGVYQVAPAAQSGGGLAGVNVSSSVNVNWQGAGVDEEAMAYTIGRRIVSDIKARMQNAVPATA